MNPTTTLTTQASQRQDRPDAPELSVVIPTRNRPDWLREAIVSVLSSYTGSLEVIVTDDSSDDSSASIIQGLGDLRVKYIKNTVPLGVPGNVNQGVEVASGKYIFILHDSDRVSPGLLERLTALLDANPAVTYVHTGIHYVDELGVIVKRYVHSFPLVCDGPKWQRRMLSKLDSDVSAMIMTRRDLFTKIGTFDPQFGFYADVEWAIRAAGKGDVSYVREPVLIMRPRPVGHSYAGVRWHTYEWMIEMRRKYMHVVSPLWRRLWVRVRLRTNIELSLIKDLIWCVKRSRFLDIVAGSKIFLRYSRGPVLGLYPFLTLASVAGYGRSIRMRSENGSGTRENSEHPPR